MRTASDDRLADSLAGLLDAISPTFLSAFLLPALVRTTTTTSGSSSSSHNDTDAADDDAAPFFLLPDARLFAGVGGDDTAQRRLVWAAHRRLFLPLLVRLQRRFPGFAPALHRRLLHLTTTTTPLHGGRRDRQQQGGGYESWAAYLRTRDWHAHFAYGRGEALFALRRAPGVRFNLRDKPPENWTQAEAEFMLGPASAACVRLGLGLVEWDGDEGEGEGEWAVCEGWQPCPIGSEL